MDIDSILKIITFVIEGGGKIALLAQGALAGTVITDAEIDAARQERKAATAAWDAAMNKDTP